MIQQPITVFILQIILEGLGAVLAGVAIGGMRYSRGALDRLTAFIGIGYVAGILTLFILQTWNLWHLLFH